MNDEVERLQAVRMQRRVTVAAIKMGEAQVQATGSWCGFTDMVDLYLASQAVDTVEALQCIEDQDHAYLWHLEHDKAP